MRAILVRLGWVGALIAVAYDIPWAQQDKYPDPSVEGIKLTKAWFECLHTNAQQIAGHEKPTKADAEAAVPRCLAEENAFRGLLVRIKGDPRLNASSEPYGKIPVDDMVAEFRKRHVWEIYIPHTIRRP